MPKVEFLLPTPIRPALSHFRPGSLRDISMHAYRLFGWFAQKLSRSVSVTFSSTGFSSSFSSYEYYGYLLPCWTWSEIATYMPYCGSACNIPIVFATVACILHAI